MDHEIKSAVADIEHTLAVHLRPSYMLVVGLEDTPSEINVIISCTQFKGKSIVKRTSIVFNLLYQYNSGIMSEYLLVVQSFDSDEMLEYIDNCFEENKDDETK